MMKKWIAVACLATLLVCLLTPGVSFTEDQDTVLLAKAIYAMCRDESYDAKLAVGTLAMNRVASPWFEDSLRGVLTEQHQFAIGSRYDDESLSAAHAVLAGKRTLSGDALYYQSSDTAEPWSWLSPEKTVGRYAFYREDGSL